MTLLPNDREDSGTIAYCSKSITRSFKQNALIILNRYAIVIMLGLFALGNAMIILNVESQQERLIKALLTQKIAFTESWVKVLVICKKAISGKLQLPTDIVFFRESRKGLQETLIRVSAHIKCLPLFLWSYSPDTEKMSAK